MEILAIIPARGESKGIKNKNIRVFNKLPLIAHTIKLAKKSPSISRIIVSTEDKKIKKIAEKFGAEVPFLRPKKLAQDSSEVVDAVIHLLKKLKDQKEYIPDYIILLQVTSPLRTAKDINRAIELFFKHKADSLVSVCRTENILMIKDKNNKLKILNTELLTSGNRQKLPVVYKLDGSMIYMIKTKVFLKKKSFFAGKLVGYEIERWRAVDLDEPQDFVIGELIHKNFNKIKQKIKNFKYYETY